MKLGRLVATTKYLIQVLVVAFSFSQLHLNASISAIGPVAATIGAYLLFMLAFACGVVTHDYSDVSSIPWFFRVCAYVSGVIYLVAVISIQVPLVTHVVAGCGAGVVVGWDAQRRYTSGKQPFQRYGVSVRNILGLDSGKS